jgi:sugar lactone lactonase YvrE
MPSGVGTDTVGNVYVADTENHVVRRITPAGVVSTFAGVSGVQGATDGAATAAASFTGPAGIAVIGSAGTLIVYVADTGNSTIRKIAAGAVTTLAGTAQTFGSTDAAGAAASFLFPNGLAVDGAGKIYAADTGNHTIRQITSAGVVSTLAGIAPVQGSNDAAGAAASFFGPSGVATDLAGNVYVADKGNRSVRVVTSAGGVTTFPLTGGGFDAQARPEGIALDRLGNVYVSDSGGAIFKVTPAGDISTLAGTLGQVGSADGAGATATFNSPAGIASDAAGNVYVADSGNATIRKIAPDGVVSTLAGAAGIIGSVDGTGGNANFSQPRGVATDSAGNVYVVDRANNNVRKISPTGSVTTLAGHSLEAGSANGAGAAATFNQPQGIAVDGADNVYVADTNNYTIRAITPGGVVSTIVGVPGRRGFTPGPVPATLADPIAIAIGGTTIYVLVNNSVVAAQ